MALEWTLDMDTGIAVLDNQHQRIVDDINQLGTATEAHNRSLVGQVLDELVDYTLSHFAFEESLQEAAGYQFAKPHKAVHDNFIKRIASYREKHSAGEDVAKQLHSMLCVWLVRHIKRDDMAYVLEVKGSLTQIVQDKTPQGWLSRTLGRFFH